MVKSSFLRLAAILVLIGGPAFAQVTSVDPNSVRQYPDAPSDSYDPAPDYQPVDSGSQDPYSPIAPEPAPPATYPEPTTAPVRSEAGIPRDDVLSAAENVFGRGAEGLGTLIEKILKEQGEPSAYIAGREAGGAFVVGVRYGSGTMRHKVEGDRPVYWTGPSIGFDAGADANKVFVLVYNLHDSQELFRRYPAAEGNAYFAGGFSASMMRRGSVVLIPVRLGVGLRLGVNAGYMSFSEKSRWLPF